MPTQLCCPDWGCESLCECMATLRCVGKQSFEDKCVPKQSLGTRKNVLHQADFSVIKRFRLVRDNVSR